MKREKWTKFVSVFSCLSIFWGLHVYPVQAKDTTKEPVHDLALGMSYTVTQGFHDDSLMGYENNRSKPGILTDGKTGVAGTDNDYLDPAWIGYLRQVSRSVVIDLGSTKHVDSINGDFLQHGTVGISLPRYINYYLSNDDKTWYKVGSKHPTTPLTQGGSRELIGINHVNMAARYVKVEFAVGTFSFLDEIRVLGTDTVDKGTEQLHGPIEKSTKDKGYRQQGTPQVGGVNNMYLAYLYPKGSYADDLSQYSKDDLLHVVSHVDSSGKPNGWMYDTVLFTAGGSESNYYTKDNWDYLLNELFDPTYNLNALDQATGEAKTALNDPDHKVKVVLPIPYVEPLVQNPWGTLDGKSLQLNPAVVGEHQSLVNRLKIVNWYVQQAEKRFKEANYQNIELVGFYWVKEEIGYNSASEEQFAKLSSDIVHASSIDGIGKKMYWIPFYQANGFAFWKDLGFDAVMMQPNYYFNSGMAPSPSTGSQNDLTRLQNTVALAHRYGLGVEMEGDYQMLWQGTKTDYDGQSYNGGEAVQKYYNYMNVFTQSGANKAIVGYYLGAKPTLQDLWSSTVPYIHSVYDDTYLFTNDTYTVTQPNIPPVDQGTSWSTPIVVDAKQGDIYSGTAVSGTSTYIKFPIKAGEDWNVVLTPVGSATVGMETRYWAPQQTPHGGFSYLGNQQQWLTVSNRTSQDEYIMVRVFANDGGGQYTLSLQKPTNDGTSKMNAIPLSTGTPLTGTVAKGQTVWYKVSGNKNYNFSITPSGGSAQDLQLYWGSGYNNVLASTDDTSVQTGSVTYSNPYDPQFVYFIKVDGLSDGSYTISAN